MTNYDNATVGSGNVVNDVQLQYNSFAQLIADYQSHTGTVDMSTTPVVQYGYADGSANTIRPKTLTYPNGRVLSYDYGLAGGMNDALSRIEDLLDNDGVTQLANYSYLGLAIIIQVDEAEPGIINTLLGLGGGNDPVTGDIYKGLDLFGRVKDLIWLGCPTSSSSSSSSGGAGTILERIQHGYDQASNRLWRRNLADQSETHDEFYAYDGVYRLKDLQRGTLYANERAIAPMTFEQCWGLDATGNWQNFQQDDTGTGVWDLIQARMSNPVNEITIINSRSGPAWVTPIYDPAGNMTTLPQPGAPTLGYAATYDAWNRVVSISANGATVANYAYDGLARRAAKLTYTSGVLYETRDFYYTAPDRWQVAEEQVSGVTNWQFVWGLRIRTTYCCGIGMRPDRES